MASHSLFYRVVFIVFYRVLPPFWLSILLSTLILKAGYNTQVFKESALKQKLGVRVLKVMFDESSSPIPVELKTS
jgi:hypothetical protein